jgi:hypothetical protein
MASEDELVYELDDWDEQARTALTQALVTVGITHSWEGPTLVVQADDEDAVEHLMDEVDDELALALDPSIEQVAYDLSEWSEDQRIGLVEVLADAGIPNGWEGDELYVHDLDEQRVDELLARITDPQGALEADASGGMAGAEIMSELFVSADRLMHDPQDHEGTLSLIDASRMAANVAVPYGIEDEVWSGVVAAASALARVVEGTDPDADAVIDQATALRQRLRPLI